MSLSLSDELDRSNKLERILSHLHYFVHIERVIWRLQNLAADGGLLVGRARCALDIDIALGVPPHKYITCIVHFYFDALHDKTKRSLKIDQKYDNIYCHVVVVWWLLGNRSGCTGYFHITNITFMWIKNLQPV